MNKIPMILFFILGINVAVFGQPQEEEMEWEIFSDDQFEIAYPSDWKLDNSGQMGITLFLFSPLSDETDKFRENINVIIQDLTEYDLTLEQYVELSENQIKTMLNDSEIILNEKVKNDFSEHQKIIYSCKQGDFDLKFEQFVWVIENKAYILTLTCEKNQFEANQQIGEKILNSFKIK